MVDITEVRLFVVTTREEPRRPTALIVGVACTVGVLASSLGSFRSRGEGVRVCVKSLPAGSLYS